MYTATSPSDHPDPASQLQALRAQSLWFETKSEENRARKTLLLSPHRVDTGDLRLEPLLSPRSLGQAQPLILVVDDEAIIAITLSEILIRHGYDVVWFNAAAEALSFVQLRSVDLFLSDINMPGMDGISLAAELLKRHPDCAVFLFSGRSHEPGLRQRIALLHSPVHLEAKPLRIPSLIATVRQLIPETNNEQP